MLTATKCLCGAVTIANDDFSNSMTMKTFEGLSFDIEFEQNIFSNCDHCVNHWGIDLCGCGSGKPVGECDGECDECKANIPAQQLFQQKETVLWRR